ncbi:Serine/threonine-protein kinase haspin homolog [Linum perenne]
MTSRSEDLWLELMAEEKGGAGGGGDHHRQKQQQPEQAVYQRRRPAAQPQSHLDPPLPLNQSRLSIPNRPSLAPPVKRISWNRSLSIRGRVSIAVSASVDDGPQQKDKPKLPKGRGKGKGKGKPPVHRQPPDFEKEREYFKEVDDFELLEESPSPKHSSTWVGPNPTDAVLVQPISSKLPNWLISHNFSSTSELSTTLSKILDTAEPISTDGFGNFDLKTPEKPSIKLHSNLHSTLARIHSYLPRKAVGRMENGRFCGEEVPGAEFEDIDAAVRKLSLASTSSSDLDFVDPFAALLAYCGQSAPSTLLDVLSKYCHPDDVVKVGEGTYGEAFKVGNTVCKLVPIDGDLRVNGEVQKRSEELLDEVILSKTLNGLRSNASVQNACTTFIETLELRVCQGPYDPALIRAWEEWDEQNNSENDHPKAFQEKQRYVVFILQHGGKDLESFVLLNFDEARSLLAQIVSAFAVAEAAYEFEHRDLHWGNILLSRNESSELPFTLEGKKMFLRTFGLSVSVIDFTLSRINTGHDILFFDMSSDPYLFKGPKGDKQAETYRKMKEVTNDSWERSHPRTNVLWLLYLVDILLSKKSFERSNKNERELRSLKKRLDQYKSAKEAVFDPFFSDLLGEVIS